MLVRTVTLVTLLWGCAGAGAQDFAMQRRSAPAPRACSHPTDGRWVARFYRDSEREWDALTLDLRHRDDGRVDGVMESRYWSGQLSEQEPPRCTQAGVDATAWFDVAGSFAEGRLHLEATRWRRASARCGTTPDLATYAPDHFDGPLHAMAGEWEAIDRDETDRAFQVLFRRVDCSTEAERISSRTSP